MSNELVCKNDFTAQLADLDRIQDACKKLMATKHYQNIGESGIHAILARAKALAIHPFEALNGGFHCINGKVGMSTEMMASLARQRGHSIKKDPKSTSECVILIGKRADNGDDWTCSFSKEDAIIAGLWNGPTWKKYPQVMLYNRCMSMLFRQLFPDLSLGVGYVEDELKEITKTGDYQNLPVADCEVLRAPQIEVKEEKKERPKITKEQSEEIAKILGECSNETLKKVHEFMSANNMYSYDDLTPVSYKSILEKASKELQEKKKSISEEIQEALNAS